MTHRQRSRSDLLGGLRREPRAVRRGRRRRRPVRASHAGGAMRALAGRDLEELAVAVERQVAGEGVVLPLRRRRRGVRDRPRPARDRAPPSGRGSRPAWPSACARSTRSSPTSTAERRIVDEGVVPQRVIDGAEYYEPAHAGRASRPAALWIGIAGLDLVRDADGRFRVLEDNVRTPSGFAYAAAARRALAAHLDVPPADTPRPLDDAAGRCCWHALRAAAAPTPVARAPSLLTDGEHNAAYYEHQWAAEALGVPLVEPEDARRATPSTSSTAARTPTALDTGVGELLLEPMRAGRIGVVNAFGTGVADDKLTHAYVEDMIRFYLDEEPLLPSVETFDLGRPEILERAMDVFDELVIKPRGGYGGEGVAIAPARRAVGRRGASRKAVREAPEAYVAQRMVMLSSHPTVIDGRLAPRHVDLRPLRLPRRDGEVRTLPGGLTRVAFDEGALVVNSSQNGGAKDTWVLPDEPPADRRDDLGGAARRARRPAARGRSAAARDGARDGLHARGRARRRPAGRAPAARPRHDRAAARPPLRRLPVGRPGHRPGRLRRGGAQPAARRRPSPTSTPTSSRSPSSPTRAGCRCSGSAAAPGDQRRARRHAAPAPRRRHGRLDRAPPDRARRVADPPRADRARLAARARDGRDRGRGQLLPPPGGGPARPGAAGRGVGAGRRRRGHRGATATRCSWACSGTPSRSSTSPSTSRCSARWSTRPRPGAPRREVRAA